MSQENMIPAPNTSPIPNMNPSPFDAPPINIYDDGNIPEVDLPQDGNSAEPLPESTRPRKDGPGGA